MQAVKNAPRPENPLQLRSLLGMENYHSKFIRNLSIILNPLNRLMQKEHEFWLSPDCERAFLLAKKSISSDNVLVHYNPELALTLECDASSHGVSEVISHRFPHDVESMICSMPIAVDECGREELLSNRKKGLGNCFGVVEILYVSLRKEVYVVYRSKTLAEDLRS